MKTTVLTILFIGVITLFTGCTSTQTVIKEFDANGKVIKETKTSESVISSVVNSTKDKTVVAWEDVFAGGISVSSGTSDNPTPHGKIYIGKYNKGVITLHKEHKDIQGLSSVIMATKSEVTSDLSGIKVKGVSQSQEESNQTK